MSSSRKESSMADDRPITPEQALLAVKAAGLDPGKSLTEQLNTSSDLSEETVTGWVSEAVRSSKRLRPGCSTFSTTSPRRGGG
jgi:hypothetical protein